MHKFISHENREFWWLVALQATLFAYFPYWNLTAPWAEPVTSPWAFTTTVFIAASAATSAFHWGPAFLAANLPAGRTPLGNWLVAWFCLGFVERFWIGITEGRFDAESTYIGLLIPGQESRPTLFWLIPFVAAPLAIAVSFRSWWKPIVALQLALGGGILVWALVTAWPGIWMTNPRYIGRPIQYEARLVEGVILSAAPTIVIAWAIGRRAADARAIWRSGFAGVWLPIVFSLTLGSIACEAGAERFWVPSIFRGFNWALLGPDGRSFDVAMKWTVWTMFAPLIVYTFSLRLLASEWQGRLSHLLGLLIAATAVCLTGIWDWFPESNRFATPPFSIWGWSVALLGSVAGLHAWRCHLDTQRTFTDIDQPAK